MLKKYYNVIAFVLILLGVSSVFINTVESKNKITTFEVKNSIISGNINEDNIYKIESNGYLGILSIPKINLKQGFYEYSSPLNTVDKNIEVIETSKMPDVLNGNLILAAHSGNSEIAYFKHLDQLQVQDAVYVYYKGKEYKYVIDDIYDKEKTGYIEIIRNRNKNTITLITCKKNTNLQTVFIGYMEE